MRNKNINLLDCLKYEELGMNNHLKVNLHKLFCKVQTLPEFSSRKISNKCQVFNCRQQIRARQTRLVSKNCSKRTQ